MHDSDTRGEPGERLARLFEAERHGLAGAVRGLLGRGTDVTEVVQESFLRAWRALDRGASPDDLRAWVFVITLNTARDLRRRATRRGSETDLEEVEGMLVDRNVADPGRDAERIEAVCAAREAIHRLGNQEREVFLLRVSGNLTFEAIATSLGIPVGTAKTRMRRALATLRTRLDGHAPARRERRIGS